MSTLAQRPKRGYRTLCLPISETGYERFMTENGLAKAPLNKLQERHPERFPVEFDQGYVLCGFSEPSRKRHRRCRRVRLSWGATVWTVAPAFVMPQMTAAVAQVLLLMRFHGPCWALA